MQLVSRRRFLHQGLAAAGLASSPLAITALAGCVEQGRPLQQVKGYGRLRPVPDQNSGLPLLLLPEGFRYTSFAWAGSAMDDGFPCPIRADGMGVLAEQDGVITLVRNHEIRGSSGPIGDPAFAYDNTGGGTVTLKFDTATEQCVASHVSLNGTLNNCAGGVTPWDTWLSCEEAPYSPANRKSYGPDSRMALWQLGNAEKEHGWVFEVPAEGVAKAEPIKAMGQFYHEAVAFDPATGIAYMTEDRSPEAGFYRFIPQQPGALRQGGRLQMLRLNGIPDMRLAIPLRTPFKVSWVDIDQPEQGHTPGSHDSGGVVGQGVRAGGTLFIALEGCAWHAGSIFFTSKLGGSEKAGQVFQYDLASETLSLIFESPAHRVLSGPDNINFSPRGNLVICEDMVRAVSHSMRLVSLTDDGDYHFLAQINPKVSAQVNGYNLAGLLPTSEWAGVCFSADGQWMFVNIFSPGISLAITGPWHPLLA